MDGPAKSILVDLRSDTLTQPTEDMKKAMLACPLGDDVYFEDPTVNLLQDTVADLFGKEAGVYLPTGTMANLIAMMCHCDTRGSEVLCGHQSHFVKYESGGAATIAGVMVSTLQNKSDGTFDMSEFEAAIKKTDYHQPITQVVTIENTHNMCGGKVMPLEWINDVARTAKKHSVAVHMDGARLFNALPFYDVDPQEVVRNCDSISTCFSKGLGAPAGSVLVGTKKFIDKARRHKKALGGAMRQSGVLAATALYALDHIAPLLKFDHQRASKFAKAINGIKHPHFSIDSDSKQTNIVILKMSPDCKVKADDVVEMLITPNQHCTDENGNAIKVRIYSRDDHNLRFVFYYGISDEMNDLAIKKVLHVIDNIK